MLIYLLVPLLSVAWGRPRNPMQNSNLFQGDITGIDSLYDRNGNPRESQRWPSGIIPYKIDSELNYFKENILKAMKRISDKTCIKFIPRTTQRDYLKIFDEDGCSSDWGKTGGPQTLSLGEGCEDVGTIIHELGHAIGFKHEHTRSDRDDYVTIYWDNIQKGDEYQFFKMNPSKEKLIGKFDYDSVMIYDEREFSVDDIKKTIVAKKEGVRLIDAAKKFKLTASDAYKINTLYKNCE